MSKDETPDGGKARAIRARQRAIGRELRRMYDGVVNEPVPDDFMDLLRKMDDGEAPSDEKKKSS
ncbi:MAG TPA: NepR family anti-sigma factor [Rhizomicrobium sp.]|nr:NepR family anti-sigma factor [Rhizomicrobium sp.]